MTLENSHGDITVDDVVTATIDASHGDTLVSTVHEIVSVDSSHGHIDVRDVFGSVEVKTSHDDIMLTNVSGLVTARNSHGDITGTKLEGGRLDLDTSFGSIKVSTLANSIACKNQHGDIAIVSLSPELHEVSAKTSFSDLTLTLPIDCQPQLKTSVTFGDIESDFASSTSVGPAVELKVEHGDIRVRRMQAAEQE